MAKVSVIMSVYNEPLEYIRESIGSILGQTFQDFELIIINDNPKRQELRDFVLSFNDSRIVYHQNLENVGLAESMNYAASISEGQFLARMDADDIAEVDRLEKECAAMETCEHDLVFSSYSYIDEHSRSCMEDFVVDTYDERMLPKLVLTKHIIHHPTVMMTREIFNLVGGYRNFPCAQDYDLWLRMLYAGCRFLMLPEKLLRYRINTKGITNTKLFQQRLTINYINELFVERLKFGYDHHTESRYKKYLLKKGLTDEKTENRLRKANRLVERANVASHKGKNILAALFKLQAFATSGVLRRAYFDRLVKTVLFKKAKETNFR